MPYHTICCQAMPGHNMQDCTTPCHVKLYRALPSYTVVQHSGIVYYTILCSAMLCGIQCILCSIDHTHTTHYFTCTADNSVLWNAKLYYRRGTTASCGSAKSIHRTSTLTRAASQSTGRIRAEERGGEGRRVRWRHSRPRSWRACVCVCVCVCGHGMRITTCSSIV